MIEQLNLKFVSVTPPAAINDNTAYTTATIDTLGWDYVTFVVYFGAMDIAMAVLKLTESDDSGMSGAVDVSGGDFSVSPATLPSATDDNHFFAVSVNMNNGRKRYLDLSATAGDGSAGTYAAIFAILSRGKITPYTASDRGFTQQLIV